MTQKSKILENMLFINYWKIAEVLVRPKSIADHSKDL